MGIYVDILQNGVNNHGVTVDDFNGFATDVLIDGVVGVITNTVGVAPSTGAFATNAQGTPDMTVAVTAGNAYVTGTPTSGVSQRLRVKLDANDNVTIASNATGGTRYDWVYIKLDADKMKDPAVDASDVATLYVSRSTSSSTDNGNPPTYGYCIAVVTVANAATSIANASIADKRVQTSPQVSEAGIAATPWKSWTPTTTNLTVGTGGSINAKYIQLGKTVHFRIRVTLGSSAFSVGSTPTMTLPVNHNAIYSYNVISGARYEDVNGSWIVGLTIINDNKVTPMLFASTWTGVTATAPFTWAAGDMMHLQGTYEAA